MVSGSDVKEAGKGKTDLTQETSTAKKGGKRRRGSDRLPSRVYVVKAGDTPQGIAEKVGVPIEKLRSLNPDILGDAQTLVVGARIKLK
ncbi:MAG: LysM peptidoglycan-binding domain-containing protein [Thermoleophilaceae bacterium]|nr:LysM peptidoglycan-binding domain-containing protein [Thermoleophilaceae bacterium]